MKTAIKRKLIAAFKSGDYLLNLKNPDAPLCEILPNGDHRFSPAGVLCDLAPKEVADWEVWIDCAVIRWSGGMFCHAYTPTLEVQSWAGCGGAITYRINGHRTLAATIKAIEEL